ncbi:MAG TPA: DNA primase [Erysipelotrichaceae bacterium]|nr:DNA primase [Solobacterium sp.]HAE16310.1 DNA primase [Erysipelotrichaceae bacterium]
MPRISEQEISELRSRADIVDVVGHYLQLHRKGKSYVALCPFHDDHSPSMSVSPERQIYKCFVCGAGGNVFSFVQNYEKVSYPEAVARVADLVGFELSEKPEAISKPSDPYKERLYDLMNETVRFTMYQINTAEASLEKNYLEDRGLDEELRQKFEIGFNPGNDQLYKFLKAKGYEDSDMTACNVIRVSPSGVHDVFAQRITFPIHDPSGNPIGFSARTINPDNSSKYINTNDTVLFHKSDVVYNSHRARNEARRSGRIYVCEGVTDVIAFARAGMDNAVCTLGTSCTENQIRQIKRLSRKVVFCYDGDDAGQSATLRAAKMARREGCDVTIIDNRTGLDPDELIRSRGAEALKQMVSNEISWMEFVLAYLRKHTNMSNYLEKKEMVKKAQAEIAELDDELDRQHFTKELSEMTGFRIEYTPGNHKRIYTTETLQKAGAPDGTRQAEDLILAMMLNSSQACRRFEERLGFLPEADRNAAAMMLVDTGRNSVIDAAALIDSTSDVKMKELIAYIASTAEDMPYDEKIMDGAIRKIMISVKSAQADAFRDSLQQPMNAESFAVISREYQECLRDLRRYIDEDNSEQPIE